MNYLERNHLVIAEIGQNLRLERGYQIGRDPGTRFTSMGHYKSDILGSDTYVGLKESKKFRGYVSRFVAARDLALLRKVEREMPRLLQEFPSFYGLLIDATGKEVGIICEDFSQGGKHEVREVIRSWLVSVEDAEVPKELEQLKGRKMDNRDLARMCFLVDGKRRIGDFEEIFSGLSGTEWEERLQFNDLLKQIGKYTLRVRYKIPPL